jgi:hypothetical protein
VPVPATIMTRDVKPAPGSLTYRVPLRNEGTCCLLAAQRPGRPSGSALRVLRSDQLCDLRGVESRALAEVVAAHEEVDGPGIVK